MSRTDEDREAARLEREHRRAEREGEAGRAVETEVVDDEDQPLDGEDQSLDGEDDVVDGDDHAADGEDHAVDGEDHAVDGEDVAAGTRRVSRLHRQQSGPSALRPARRPPRPTKRKHSWLGRVVAVLAILLGAGVIWFLFELIQPVHGSGHGRVEVAIPAHSSSSQIGDLLERDGVIASSFFFDARATLAGDRGDLRSGTYRLKLDMSYGDVLTALTTPPKAAKVSELTITEGRTRRQIDALLRSQRVHGSYFAQTHHSKLLNPRAYGAPRNANSLEGFLFPSTYQLRDPISIGALIADQLRTFRQKFKGVNLGYARRKHLTPYDVLTIASMVEEESRTEHDRPLVAAAIYNRLARGMPLQIDATTRYETGNYSRPLTASQLSSRSPYNTRIHKGLPPTPIGNPGMPSIEAAAHPAHKSYLYFVVKACGNGEQVFTASYSQFLKDVQRYQAARNAKGGRSPERC